METSQVKYHKFVTESYDVNILMAYYMKKKSLTLLLEISQRSCEIIRHKWLRSLLYITENHCTKASKSCKGCSIN